jgi:hypothetical protein
MDFRNLTRKEFEEWKSQNPQFKNIDFEGFKKFLIEEQEKGNYFQDSLEYQKDQFLKYVLYASIGLGFFFPLIWIGTVILFIIRVLRKK